MKFNPITNLPLMIQGTIYVRRERCAKVLSSADYKNEPIVKIEPDWAKSHPFLNLLIRFEPIRILYPIHQLLSNKKEVPCVPLFSVFWSRELNTLAQT